MTQLANEMASAISEMAASFFDVPSRIGNEPSVLPAEVEDYFTRKIYEVGTYKRDVTFDYELKNGSKTYYYEMRFDYLDPTYHIYECPWGNESELASVSFGSLDCTVDVYDDEDGSETHYVVPIDDKDFERRLNTNL